MLPLQTKVEFNPPPFSIHYTNTISMLGSCFAQHIGNRLEQLKFKTLVNPFGVLYNPASLANSLENLCNREIYTESDLHYHDNKWFSFDHYTAFSDNNKEKCLLGINTSFSRAKDIFNITDILVVTLGTARVFRHKQTNSIVGNCHKLPAAEFTEEFLEPDEIVKILSIAFQKIASLRPNLKIILTVSPIRHWKDGAIENMRSKASLILAIKQLELAFQNICYFPVYEIFMDELRDYRFYADDMLHPSEFAINYIFEKFKQTFFSQETLEYVTRCDKIVRMLNHRPINPDDKSKEIFLAHLARQSVDFSRTYPHVDFVHEISELEKRLNNY